MSFFSNIFLKPTLVTFTKVWANVGVSLGKEGMQLAPWAVAGGLAGTWFAYPALKHAGATDYINQSINPYAPAKPAEN